MTVATIIEVPIEQMTRCQFERQVFKIAREHGWRGKEPSLLGHLAATNAYNDALTFCRRKRITAYERLQSAFNSATEVQHGAMRR